VPAIIVHEGDNTQHCAAQAVARYLSRPAALRSMYCVSNGVCCCQRCAAKTQMLPMQNQAPFSPAGKQNQSVACSPTQIYCRPTYEFVEVRFMDINQSAMSRRNVIVRFILTLIYIVIITTLCCMLPFFADFVALCGAIGFTPLVRFTSLSWPLPCTLLYPVPRARILPA